MRRAGVIRKSGRRRDSALVGAEAIFWLVLVLAIGFGGQRALSGMPLLMSKKTWDAMSEAERKIIREAADEAKKVQREATLAKEAQAVEGLKKTMQVNEVSPQELARLRQKVQPVVDKFSREVGEGVYKQVVDELARLRGGK